MAAADAAAAAAATAPAVPRAIAEAEEMGGGVTPLHIVACWRWGLTQGHGGGGGATACRHREVVEALLAASAA